MGASYVDRHLAPPADVALLLFVRSPCSLGCDVTSYMPALYLSGCCFSRRAPYRAARFKMQDDAGCMSLQ